MVRILLLIIPLFLFSFQKYTYVKISGKSYKIHTVEYYKNQFKYLSVKQKKNANKVWEKAKQFNLQYTMTAIAFKESSFGRALLNDNDGRGTDLGSYGIFHNLVDSVYDRYMDVKPKSKIKQWEIKLHLAKRLRDDFDFSFTQALAELKYWENYAIARGQKWNKWKLMIMCYNGGTYGDKNIKSIIYYYEIVNIIKAIKWYKQHQKLIEK